MAKVFYGLAILALIIALMDLSGGAAGSERQREAGFLIIVTPVFALVGFAISRAATKKCPKCSERIKKDALKCKHCGSELESGT